MNGESSVGLNIIGGFALIAVWGWIWWALSAYNLRLAFGVWFGLNLVALVAFGVWGVTR